MNGNILWRFFGFLVLVLGLSCRQPYVLNRPLEKQMNEIKGTFAPDKRVALFNVSVEKKGKYFILKGESNMADAIAAFKQKLSLEKIAFIDSIQLLPSPDLKGKTRAVITISVANLRSAPKHAAELATQATLGTPVKVLKKEGGWYFIQTPDKYLSWVDSGGITLMDAERFEAWHSRNKIIYTKTYGHAYDVDNKNAIVSDVVAGVVMEFVKQIEGYFVIAFPDGRKGLVRTTEAEDYFSWLSTMEPSEDDLVATSKKLIGVPYLWGGTSTKGMDCSGFTKTIYFLNGMVIPRDASQQVHTGKRIDSLKNFEYLKKGDLLFFGRKATDSTAEKVVHVGMWIGNNEFIHASNMVRISSIDPKAGNFDEYNLKRYLKSKRILKEKDKDLIDLTRTPVFK